MVPSASALDAAVYIQSDRKYFLLILCLQPCYIIRRRRCGGDEKKATNRVTSTFLEWTPTSPETISGGSPKEIRDKLVDVASRASEAVGQQYQTFPVYLNE